MYPRERFQHLRFADYSTASGTAIGQRYGGG